MKVLLLEHPRGTSATHFNDVANAPLSSCLFTGYVASLLTRNGFEVEILDAYRTGSFDSMVNEVAEKRSYDLLGVHLIYSWEQTPQVLRALQDIGKYKKSPLVVYGFYPTFAYHDLLNSCSAIDYLIIGEPEITFVELCRCIQEQSPPGKINGLCYRQGDTVVVNKRRGVIENLDFLPFPLRTPIPADQCSGNILGSRGCYGNCTFCYINNFYGNGGQWRGRSPENIGREVQEILGTLSQNYLYFVDANFYGPGDEGQKRVLRIAEILQGMRRLSFGLECRVNDVREDSLRALVNAGLKDVFLGIESGSPRSLKRMSKGTTIEQSRKALHLLRGYGIEPYCGFIMFEPDSELKDLRDNFNFLTSHHLLSRITSTVDLLYHPQILLQGTESYEKHLTQRSLTLMPCNLYQGTVTFKDERVAFIAEVMSCVSRALLTQMDTADSPLYWKRFTDSCAPQHSLAQRLNQWLVNLFDELLTKVERRDITCNGDTMNRYLSESLEVLATATMKNEDERKHSL